jgi:GxxExxY protein
MFTTEVAESTEEAMERDPLTGQVIGLAIEVHRVLGPGLLESTYLQCLAHELHRHGIPFRLEHPLPVEYKGVRLDCGYRIDLLIEDRLIVELKAVEEVRGIHRAQLLTYMKLSGIKTGLLLNFNVQRLVDGTERFKV